MISPSGVGTRPTLRGARQSIIGIRHLDDIVSDRIKHQFTDRMKLQLAHQIGAERFCSLDSQTESDRYFFRALSFCYQLNDFALSHREPVVPHTSVAG